MKTIFIADAHLKGPKDPNQQAIIEFIGGLNDIGTLVILGDFFDFWIGENSFIFRRYLPVLDSLLRLKSRGTKIIYLEGNHDFSVGGFFTVGLGASVHRDTCDFIDGGKRMLLSHGDIVSMTFGYKLWRAFIRSLFFRGFTRALSAISPKTVWRIGGYLSRRSRAYDADNNERGKRIEGALKTYARERIAEGYDCVVLAHSHVGGIHVESVDDRSGIYANPGSWLAGMNYLVYENGKFTLAQYRPKATKA